MKKIILIVALIIIIILLGLLIFVSVKKNKAMDVILNELGVNESDVDVVESSIDMEGLSLIYEIELYYQNVKYDYTVKGNEIISVDKKGDNNQVKNENPNNINKENTTDLGEEQAKQIALKHAGVAGNDVKNIIATKDLENGSLEYDIEFIYDGLKYEYTVNNNGEVTSFEKEKVRQ